MTNQTDLRATFNQSAGDYNAARPTYPPQMFDDIFSRSDFAPSPRALEIGCGTGQATLPFARRGCQIHCLDIGSHLLAIAAENLRDYPNVSFEETSFEDWLLQAGAFDLVYAATSFHWIAPEVGYPKAAQALKAGGALAVFSNTHPRPLNGFFSEVQSIYAQFMPKLADPNPRMDSGSAAQAKAQAMRAMGLFSRVELLTYPWTKVYSSAEYIQLLNTYSDHIALEVNRRRALYEGIAELIERRYDGKVERPYLTELFLAKTPPL